MKATPQIIYLVYMLISLLVNANRHGKPVGNADFWIAAFYSIATLGVLWWGGFFDVLFK